MKKELAAPLAVIGGLSRTQKMPGYSYSTPAQKCRVGSALAVTPGTVCHGCYARKGRYVFGVVQSALQRRLDQWLAHKADPGPWVDAFTACLLGLPDSVFFRWFDSGDLESVKMLNAIVAIAHRTPHIRHWLPTRESGILREFHALGGKIPPNLVIRYSLPLIDGPDTVPPIVGKIGAQVAKVTRHAASVTCPAYQQGGQCGDCRRCWDSSQHTVTYLKH